MTNTPAAIIELLGQPKGEAIRFTCGDSAGIDKGDILWLASPYTVSGASVAGGLAAGKPFAGIASSEKVKDDGSTTIGCWTRGIFDIQNSGGGVVNAGQYVMLSGVNTVVPAVSAAHISGGFIVGRAMEEGSDPETIRVEIGRL